MYHTLYLITALLAGSFSLSAPAFGQSAAPDSSHVIVVKLLAKGGSMPYVFEPSNVTVQHGNTVRFVEDASVMHNVHFKTHPSDSKLGGITTGPYLTTKGQTYDVVIDNRFTDGVYTFVCDPHEMVGMRGTLTVKGKATKE